MPALVMSPPSTTIATPPSTKLERRRSIEDYQRQIINRIKDHFQRSRDEWQRKIRGKKLSAQRTGGGAERRGKAADENTRCSSGGCGGAEDISGRRGDATSARHTTDTTSHHHHHDTVPCHDDDDTHDRLTDTASSSPSVRVLSCIVVARKSPRHHDIQQVTVDISAFLPNGEVAFHTEKNGLLVCAKCPASRQHAAVEQVKVIPVPGLIETERIKVIPVSKGVMTLELKISQH